MLASFNSHLHLKGFEKKIARNYESRVECGGINQQIQIRSLCVVEYHGINIYQLKVVGVYLFCNFVKGMLDH